MLVLLILDLASNYIGSYIITARPNIVAVRPEPPAPEPFSHLREFFKELLGRDAFQNIRNLGRPIARRGRQQQVHVVFQYCQRIHRKLILLCYLLKQFFSSLGYCTFQDCTPILGYPNEMVVQTIDGMPGAKRFAYNGSPSAGDEVRSVIVGESYALVQPRPARLAAFLPTALRWGFPPIFL